MSRNHGRRTNPQTSKASKNADEDARCRFRLESPVRGPVLFGHLPRLSSQEGESTGFLQTDVIRVGGRLSLSREALCRCLLQHPGKGEAGFSPTPPRGLAPASSASSSLMLSKHGSFWDATPREKQTTSTWMSFFLPPGKFLQSGV